jgi:hypothetical protein
MSELQPEGREVFQVGGNEVPGVATDTIEVSIAWDEDAEAMLIRLVDNDVAIELPGHGVPGRRGLAVTYRAAAAVQHVIEWRLTFPGRTLTELVCSGRRAGGQRQELNNADEAASVWAKSGVLS